MSNNESGFGTCSKISKSKRKTSLVESYWGVIAIREDTSGRTCFQ